MMEFTLSRLVMIACGVMVLASLMNPLSSVYDGRYDSEMQDQCDNISDMVDTFGRSGMVRMTVPGREIIPSGCTLSFDENMVRLGHDGREFLSCCSFGLSSDCTYGGCDTISMVKENGMIVVTSI